jgi:hypothetical protein
LVVFVYFHLKRTQKGALEVIFKEFAKVQSRFEKRQNFLACAVAGLYQIIFLLVFP